MTEHHIHAYVNRFQRYVVTFQPSKYDGLVTWLYSPGYSGPSRQVPREFVIAMCTRLTQHPVLISSIDHHFDPIIPKKKSSMRDHGTRGRAAKDPAYAVVPGEGGGGVAQTLTTAAGLIQLDEVGLALDFSHPPPLDEDGLGGLIVDKPFKKRKHGGRGSRS